MLHDVMYAMKVGNILQFSVMWCYTRRRRNIKEKNSTESSITSLWVRLLGQIHQLFFLNLLGSHGLQPLHPGEWKKAVDFKD